MPVYDYATRFESMLAQKYAAASKSDALFGSNPAVTFLSAQTIKLPRLTVSGYRDHNRAAVGFNTGTVQNDWEPKKLTFDRDIEFAIDPMDIDETNLTLAIANVQNAFEDEQAIPERDSYAFSKLYSEYTAAGNIPDSTGLTAATFLEKFDDDMAAMDDAGVPETGRILYCTAGHMKLIKEAEGVQRAILISGPAGVVSRKVHSLDDVQLVSVPYSRLMTAYDFTEGVKPAEEAKQIHHILIHPSAVVARQKYSYIKVFTPGSDSRTADKYIYQNRRYMDLFLLARKADGVRMNVEASAQSAGTD